MLPSDLTKAAAPVEIDQFVFVEVDVDFPQHLDEAAWVAEQAAADPRLTGMVAALPLERGAAIEPELEQLRQHKILRAIRRLIQTQPDPEFCIRPDFIAGLKLLPQHDLAFDICILHHQMPNVIRMVAPVPGGALRARPHRQARDQGRDLRSLAAAAEGAGRIAERALQDLRRHHRGRPQATGRASSSSPTSPTPSRPSASTASCMAATGTCSELAGTYPQWVEIVDWVVEGCTRGGEAQAVPRQRDQLLPPERLTRRSCARPILQRRGF